MAVGCFSISVAALLGKGLQRTSSNDERDGPAECCNPTQPDPVRNNNIYSDSTLSMTLRSLTYNMIFFKDKKCWKISLKIRINYNGFEFQVPWGKTDEHLPKIYDSRKNSRAISPTHKKVENNKNKKWKLMSFYESMNCMQWILTVIIKNLRILKLF